MNIKYSNYKDVECYRDFVLNPDDRICSRNFSKRFGVSLMEPAIKLHDRLVNYYSVGDYNAVYGRTENRIEIKKATHSKEPMVFKVRVGRVVRKFFNQIINENNDLLITSDWKGDFDSIRTIYITSVNNHNYNI